MVRVGVRVRVREGAVACVSLMCPPEPYMILCAEMVASTLMQPRTLTRQPFLSLSHSASRTPMTPEVVSSPARRGPECSLAPVGVRVSVKLRVCVRSRTR